MNNLATLYVDKGQFSEAQALLLKALEVRRRVLGEEHPDTLFSINNLAMLYRTGGQLDKAEPLLLKALEVRRRVLGEEHPNTLNSMNNLAVLYRDQGQFEKAEKLIVKTIEVRRRVQGEEHPEALKSMMNLGSILVAKKAYAEAENQLISCQAAMEKNTNAAPVLRQLVVSNLVKLYDAWNKPDEAEKWRAKLSPAARIRDGLERHHAWPLLWGWPRF
jgi:tetratricopeptide (TPR) repeat protein